MKHSIVETIYSKAYSDYRSNKASDDDVATLASESPVTPDKDYLEFLKTINGFELNGLNVYGTREQPQIYVSSALQQNEFWSMEIPELKRYFIIGDGDMDFYCFYPQEKKYYVLTKATLTQVDVFENFELLMEDLVRIFGN
jgi:hypothetical protein